jgi:hypothetical protein
MLPGASLREMQHARQASMQPIESCGLSNPIRGLLDNLHEEFLQIVTEKEFEILALQEGRGYKGIRGLTDKVSSRLWPPFICRSPPLVTIHHLPMSSWSMEIARALTKLYTSCLTSALLLVMLESGETS